MNAEKIYHTYFMQVYSFVMNIVKDPGLAEEITQSTFFKAMTAKSDFKKEAAEYTWLCSIAKNLCNDHFRKSKRISDSSEDIEILSDYTHVEDDFITKESSFAIHKLLHELEEPYKEVFELRVFGELSFAEIAFSTVFGLSLPLFPIVAYQADLPETLKNHKGLLCMIWDTVWFYLMIFAFCIDYPNAIHDLLVVSSFYVVAAWLVFLAIRYLPCNGFVKAGILIAVCGVSLGIGNQMGWVQLMDRDIHLQMEVGAGLIGLVFVLVGMVLHLRKKSQ